MKIPSAFRKLWHAMRSMKSLVVLGVALYDAVRAMQFSHEGELQLAIYNLLWGVAILMLYIASVIPTTRALAWYKCLECKTEFAPGASAEAPRWCPVCGQPAPEKK
jgi:rubrerythrin